MKRAVAVLLLLGLLFQAAAGGFPVYSSNVPREEFQPGAPAPLDMPTWADGWFNGTLYRGQEAAGTVEGYLAVGRRPTVGRFEGQWREDGGDGGTLAGRFYGPLVVGSAAGGSGMRPLLGWLTRNDTHFGLRLLSPVTGGALSVEGTHYESFLPAPSGPYPIGTQTVHLVDESRGEEFTEDEEDFREMMVQLWYPAGETRGERAEYMDPVTFGWLKHRAPIPLFMIPDRAYTFVHTHAYLEPDAAPGAFPVLVFSHGYDGVRAIYTSLIEELASHGFVVAAVNHPYIAGITVFPDGRTVELAPVPGDAQQRDLYFQRAFRAVTGDILFTLDYLTRCNDLHPILSGHLDLERVGVYGHSFGGGATADVCLRDARFRAGATLDGFFRGEVVQAGLETPLLLMLAEGRTRGSDIQELWSSLEGSAYRAEVNGSAHYSYTDVGILLSHLAPLLPRGILGFGSIDPGRLVFITNALLRAFFDVHLNGAPVGTLLSLADEFEEVWFAYR